LTATIHVDALGAHRLRKHLLELVEADLPLHLPSASRLLG
jgi:hypothetical protein